MLGRQVNAPRVLVISPGPAGREIAGPVIRALALARVLGARFPTMLALPGGAAPALRGEPFETCRWSRRGAGRLLPRFDVVVSQGTQYPARHTLRRNGRPPLQVFDLYDPLVFENLHDGGDAGHLGRLTGLLLRRADYVLCASARQRDLWTGGLYVAGRLSRAGASLSRIGVVPFGHDGTEPRASGRALRGVHPGIAEGDRVLLWGGGVWSWLDPATLLRAMARLATTDPRVKLVFLGGRHPAGAQTGDRMLREAPSLAASLGLLDRTVFFHDGWVPYERRAGYLLESDLAVCAAPDGLENRFAFRTRLVDAVWAGLPVVTTRGEAMADFVERHELGLTVAAGDPGALATAITEALRPESQRRFRANLRGARDLLRWDRCARPLSEFCDRAGRGEVRRAAEPPWTPWLQYLRYKLPAVVR